MSDLFRITLPEIAFEVFAEDDVDALEQSTASHLLGEGDAGSVEQIEVEAVEPYTPEGPG